jgi:hypothetical protein
MASQRVIQPGFLLAPEKPPCAAVEPQVIEAAVITLSRASYTVAVNGTRRPREKVDSAGVIVRRAAGSPVHR